jgi:hypothetical protein
VEVLQGKGALDRAATRVQEPRLKAQYWRF